MVVLYVALLSTTLYGGVVPEYRTAAGAEVGERALAESAQRVQQAVPADARRVAVRQQVTLPDTLGGSEYDIRVEDRSLVLDHPGEGIGGSVRLALPPTVESVSGEWSSREAAVVVVRTSSDGDGLAVRLESERRDRDEASPDDGGSDR